MADIKCPRCDGRGWTECECTECGQMHTAKCTRCDGHGVTGEAK